jgi:hypothetical protein
MSKPDPVKFLADGIEKYCVRKGFAITRDPVELLKTQTKSSDMQSRLRIEKERQNTDLRTDTFAAIEQESKSSHWQQMNEIKRPIGFYIKTHSSYAVQIGMIDDTEIIGDWPEEYRSRMIRRWQGYQQFAAIARTWLSAQYSDDLNLFLVGPIGSSEEPEWRNFSEAVERNELVCRKLVWLPSKDDATWSEEIDRFIKRTFLAEPWYRADGKVGVPLDSLSDVYTDFENWLAVIDRPEFTGIDRDYDALVTALLEASKE